MNCILFTILAFLCGSIPFSVWIGKFALRKDIRAYGDGNPGAFNVIRAGGIVWGALAIFLDVFKAALPVGMAAYVLDFTGLSLVLIAIAPSFGHAFSPFLRFQGGKAIATTAGMWIGLTLGEVAIVMLVMLLFWYTSLTSSAWSVILTMLSILLYMTLTGAPSTWLASWVAMILLSLYKHRQELAHLPCLKMSPLLRPVLYKRYFQEPLC